MIDLLFDDNLLFFIHKMSLQIIAHFGSLGPKNVKISKNNQQP